MFFLSLKTQKRKNLKPLDVELELKLYSREKRKEKKTIA
jgi:hypothetical protein